MPITGRGWTWTCKLPRVLLATTMRDVAWGHLGNPQLDEHMRPKGSELNARWAALRPRVLEARACARETTRLLAHHVTAR